MLARGSGVIQPLNVGVIAGFLRWLVPEKARGTFPNTGAGERVPNHAEGATGRRRPASERREYWHPQPHRARCSRRPASCAPTPRAPRDPRVRRPQRGPMTTRARRAARRSLYRRLERGDRSRVRGDGAWRGRRPANATARRCSPSGDMPRLQAPFPHACKRRGRAKSSRRRASSPPPTPRLRKLDPARSIGGPMDARHSQTLALKVSCVRACMTR
jgi:hypothetical protein